MPALDFESHTPFVADHFAVDDRVPYPDAPHVHCESFLSEVARNSPLQPFFIHHSLALPEIPLFSFLGNESEPVLDHVNAFLFGHCDFAYPLICLEVDEVRVDEGVSDVFVPENLHYVEDVFRFVIFHCSLEVSQGLEGYALDSWVLKFLCGSASLGGENSAECFHR